MSPRKEVIVAGRVTLACTVSMGWLTVPVVLSIALLGLCTAGCSPRDSVVGSVRSPTVPFDELFVLEDTIRLDPAFLIGEIGFLDISTEGRILVTDHQASTALLYSPSGSYVRSYSASACLPDDAHFHPWSTRFIGRGRVMTMQFAGAAVVFGADGGCYASTRLLTPSAKAFCASEDSIITQQAWIDEQAAANVHLPSLQAIGAVDIERPRLQLLNEQYAGQRGRTIACFDGGPFFVYAESMDAMPVSSSLASTQFRPDFFQRRPDDLPETTPDEQIRLQRQYPSTIAVFALDASTRMVVYADLRDRWHLMGIPLTNQVGLNIASNAGHFSARSTVSPVHPMASRNGYLYAVGDHERLSDGDIGNPVILRYRFVVPNDAD